MGEGIIPTLLAAALLVCVARAAVLSFHWALIHDAITMQYIAALMLEGILPYRDIFDMNFPLTYWIHGLGMLLLGKSDFATRAYDLLWCYFAGLAIAACIWRESRWGALCAGLVFALIHIIFGGYMNQLQRDFFMVPLLVAGLRFTLYNPRPLLAGLCIGAACAIKPVAAVFALLVLVFFRPRRMPDYVVGLAILPTLSFAWMLGMGIFDPFWDILWHFTLPIFASRRFDSTFPFDWQVPYIVGGALAFHLLAWRKQFLCRESLLLLAGLAYGLVHYYAQQKGYGQHLYPFWGFLCVLLGVAFARCTRQFPRLMPLAALLSLAVFPHKLLWKEAGFFRYTPLVDGSLRLEQELAATGMLAEGGRVQVLEDIFGTAWRVAYRHGWKPVSRFMYPFILYAGKDSEAMLRYRGEFALSLMKTPPKMVLLSSNTWPQYKPLVYAAFDKQPGMKLFLGWHYLLLVDNKRMRIWHRKY